MAKKRKLWPRRFRRIVQTLAFAAFLFVIARMPGLVGSRAGGDWVMRLSALSGIGASISSWQPIWAFWPGIALLLAAAMLGRYFCGWLCPLGATLDIADRAISFLRGRTAKRRSPALEEGQDFEHIGGRRLKYYLLTACLIGAFLGTSFFGLFDPLSIAVRSYVLVVHSYAADVVPALMGALGSNTAARGARTALMAEAAPVFQLHLLTLAILLGLLGLGLIRRRFWCRYLCPLGALHALIGKWSMPERSTGAECTECGICARVCPMGCISPDGRRTLLDECTLCLQCQATCPTGAVGFLGPILPEQKREVSLTRRGVLVAAATGAAAYPAFRLALPWSRARGDPLIRPPLAGRDAEAFLRKCLRCGQCMRACPTNVIQPAGLEAGLESLWTPKLVPRPGYCVFNCEACGQACPSGAIPRFDLEQKHVTAMGLAYVDTGRCIPWRGVQRRDEEGFVADRHNCGVCEEVCPVPGKAIHFRPVYDSGHEGENDHELRLPHVLPEACVGCGFCESVCPVKGKAAIRVTGGFRELLAVAPSGIQAPTPAAEQALPARVGELRLAGAKITYEGPRRLFEYINGGADLYLTFNFLRVTAAGYTDGTNRLKVDLWEFRTADDAYGAYAKDRQGGPIELGDEGSMLDGSLWARRGRYMFVATDLGRTPPDQVRRLAIEVFKALGERPALRPTVCRRLPEGKLDAGSVLFMRDEAPLFDVVLAHNYIPDGTFGIEKGAVGAYGAYKLRSDDKPAGVLLIEYRSEDAARTAAARLTELRAEWGELQIAEEPVALFRAGDNDFCVIGASGNIFAAAFFTPSAEAALALVQQALQ